MGRTADDIRREIEESRGHLGATLEALGDQVSPKLVKERVKEKVTDRMEEINDRVNPKRIVRRRAAGVRSSVRSARESVMGRVDDVEPSRATDAARGQAQRASRRVGGAADALGDQARSAPEAVRTGTQGNPLVAGLVAFGGGLLLASALRPTDRERQAAERILEEMEPLKEEAMSVGRGMAEDLQQSAQARAERVKKRASSGAGRVRAEAEESGEEVKGRARGASKQVQKRARGATRQVRKEAQRSSQTVKKQARKAPGPVKAGATARRQGGGRRATSPS